MVIACIPVDTSVTPGGKILDLKHQKHTSWDEGMSTSATSGELAITVADTGH